MSHLRSIATTDPVPTPVAPLPPGARLQADLAALQAELIAGRAERDQLRGLRAALLADQLHLRVHRAATHAPLAAVAAARRDPRQELVDLKRNPFTARTRAADTPPAQPRGRAAGHPGRSRRRPPRSDHPQAIPAGDTGPDGGTPFSGAGTTRARVVEDSVLVRPPGITP